AIAWSYDLLEPEVQRLFALLADFRGGFTLSALEAVAVEAGDIGAEAVNRLSVLIDNALVVRRPEHDESSTYMLLEPLRGVALELLQADDRCVRIDSAHARFFFVSIGLARPHLRQGDPMPWLGELERDHGNIRAALDRMSGHEEHNMALEAVQGLRWY